MVCGHTHELYAWIICCLLSSFGWLQREFRCDSVSAWQCMLGKQPTFKSYHLRTPKHLALNLRLLTWQESPLGVAVTLNDFLIVVSISTSNAFSSLLFSSKSIFSEIQSLARLESEIPSAHRCFELSLTWLISNMLTITRRHNLRLLERSGLKMGINSGRCQTMPRG